MKRIVECVPNFSEGRDPSIIAKILGPFRGKKDVKLLDYQRDEDHNRLVVTVVGEPDPLKLAVIESIAAAVEVIDMRRHRGQHPRMGAADVVPFVPIMGVNMQDAVALSRDVARTVARQLDLPVFLYEQSATASHRRNLAAVRKGQFEGLAEKMKLPEWQADFGPAAAHPTAGATAIGARMPLVAFNVNLHSDRLDIAQNIAKNVRHLSGGLRYCKALGIELKDRGMVQVSMNMTDYTHTALYRAVELIRAEARRYGVGIAGSEIIGLVPMDALVDTAAYYLGLEGFSMDQVLENRLME